MNIPVDILVCRVLPFFFLQLFCLSSSRLLCLACSNICQACLICSPFLKRLSDLSFLFFSFLSFVSFAPFFLSTLTGAGFAQVARADESSIGVPALQGRKNRAHISRPPSFFLAQPGSLCRRRKNSRFVLGPGCLFTT